MLPLLKFRWCMKSKTLFYLIRNIYSVSSNNYLKFCIYEIISSKGVLKEYFVSLYSFHNTFHWIHVKTSTSYIILFDMGKLSHLMGNWKNQFCTYHFLQWSIDRKVKASYCSIPIADLAFVCVSLQRICVQKQ